ncbi:D-alanyl-D-alanine carboxypeptidase/D-alanyl-D-alanine endopeptidase [Sphingobacterium sp. MYb382]|uniref:D-alanyl-D-alanine carboxypeptidase/D-alanyl-D-alanine endopeptidase n=1 Tax=Sphingobacterium sp. MYb382 TaxID=2745278 RepID=UPI00309A440B
MKKKWCALFLGASLLAGISVKAQDNKQLFTNAFQKFVNAGSLTNGIAAVTIMDSKTGQVVYENNGNLGLPTASTLKVITSITALDILGPSYTYKTQLYYTGEIDSLGILQGDIIIQGSGDPTLGSSRYPESNEETLLNKWSYHIKNAGITAINGRIIGDDLFLNGMNMLNGWNWADMGNYYGAGISGLNWRENKIGIRFKPGTIGQATPIDYYTANLHGIHVINEVTTAGNGTGDNVTAYSAPYSDVIYLRGTHGKDLDKTIEISVPDPALDLAQQLYSALQKQGVQVDSLCIPTTGKLLLNQGIKIQGAKTLLNSHQSPPLRDIVYWFNQKSINLYGEALLKTIGLIAGNKTNSDEAARLLAKYWEQKLKVPTSAIVMIDGSGLSPQNRVSTLAMTKIMHYALNRPWFGDFAKSLPTYNNMSMKSGTIGGTLGYTGYQKSKSGQEFTFSLLVNNYTGTATAMRQAMFTFLDNLK